MSVSGELNKYYILNFVLKPVIVVYISLVYSH